MNIIEEVKALRLPVGEYVVFGSAILQMKGIRQARDIDFIVNPGLFRDLQHRGWKRMIFFRRMFTSKAIYCGKHEAFLDAKYKTFQLTNDDLFRQAEMIYGIPFMNLVQFRDFKKVLGRPKDWHDVQLIDTFLQQNDNFSRYNPFPRKP